MSNLDRARNPDLTPIEFKELLDLEVLEIYEALDLNVAASERYIAYLETQPEVQYFPLNDEFTNETLVKANSGDHFSQFIVALECMANGDEEASKEWFRKSAENGNIISAYNYALTLENPRDQLVWLYKAAFKGFPEAQREVGRILHQLGDVSLAKIWLGLAIRRESIDALNDMGIIHWQNYEIDEAISYWNRAAQLGSQDALANLDTASTTTLFDDEDFDFDYSNNSSNFTPTNNPEPPNQPIHIQVDSSSEKKSSKRL